MGRFALQESGRFALGLAGALLMAAAVSALSVAGAGHGLAAFLSATAGRLGGFARLDFGTSAISGLGAIQELAARGPVTLTLVLIGICIAVPVGVPLGLLFGAGPMRRATAPLIQIVAAAPVFCAGLALAYVGQRLLHLPAANGGPVLAGALLHPGGAAFSAVLFPALTVGLAGAGAIQLALRRAGAEAQGEPFRIGLRRLGLSTLEIERVYVAPLVFAGLFASLGEVMLALLSASVVAEWVFHCPGIADLFVKSVALGDWNMVGLILFVFALAVQISDVLGRFAVKAITQAAP